VNKKTLISVPNEVQKFHNFPYFFNNFQRNHNLQITKTLLAKIQCSNPFCHRILFVADPQILGEVHESQIARIDSDRHLEKNFQSISKFTQPNLIIFLGDLMDEGSIATDGQFLNYLKRFEKIFEIPPNCDSIFVPGDNDIGGEGSEKVNELSVKRFETVFGAENNWKIGKNLEIFHFNLITKNVPEMNSSSDIKIVISHYPIFDDFSYEVRREIQRNKPNVIFSSHHHKSLIITERNRENLTKSTTLNLQSNETIEISVPSPNYRMGTLKIGFGMAVIEDGTLKYSPMFIISRFYIFGIYIFAIFGYSISYGCLALLRWIFRHKRRRNHRKYEKLRNEIRYE
jgi:hypothetical protein